MSRLHFRVYHDMGTECTLVPTNEHERKAVFCPGDPTLLFCVSVSEARLIDLRAYPECSAFCSVVDKHYGRSAATSGPKAYNQDAFCLLSSLLACALPMVLLLLLLLLLQCCTTSNLRQVMQQLPFMFIISMPTIDAF